MVISWTFHTIYATEVSLTKLPNARYCACLPFALVLLPNGVGLLCWKPMPARQETINEVSFFWRPMLARPVTNGNVFVFGMKDTAEIECEQANGNLWPEFFHWTCLI